MLFKGTHIVSGNGRAVVIGTGSDTVIGKISEEIATIDTEIPLKANIRNLSRLIIITVASISTLLFLLGIISGKSAKEMFAVVVSLSVSIIPEGLPIVMTLVLATGVWRMSKRNVLIKKLQAVEALGQARIIAVDKTGTLTKNEMVVQKVYLSVGKAGEDGKMFEVGGVGYEPKGDIRFFSKGGSALGEEKIIIDPLNHPELLFAGKIAAFCASARVIFSEEEKVWRVAGDPTEAAMLVFAQKIGFHKDDLERESPLVAEIPFDYKLKYHATIHRTDDANLPTGQAGLPTDRQTARQELLTVVGAPEVILNLSKISKEEKQKLESVVVSMSQAGLRVIALAATNNAPETLNPENIHSLTFVGFFGMKDALRSEVADAMQKATAAGIRVVMITGDHKITAQAIAKEAGIYHDGDIILTGQDIDAFTDAELSEKLATTSVFARVTPEHKLRIIQAYKARGEVVAMTGDGVNDAPSLVAADLGVAMGKGTEVAKEASDIVLLDDNFGSIVSAIEEGRNIYEIIHKALVFLFSTAVGEVLIISGALVVGIFTGMPLPLLASQILWVNFVGDGILGIFLAYDPKRHDLLSGTWQKPGKYILNRRSVSRLILMGATMAVGTILVFWSHYQLDYTKALTMSFTVLAMFQWLNAWNCRSITDSLFVMNPLRNAPMLGATLGVVVLHLFAVYNPLMQKLFHTVPLGLAEWLIIVSTATSIVFVEEIRKFIYRRKIKHAII